MFTDRAQEVIDLAKDYAFSSGNQELTLSAALAAVGKHPEASVLLAECVGMPPDKLRALCPDLPDPVACPSKLPLADPMRDMLQMAKDFTEDVPDHACVVGNPARLHCWICQCAKTLQFISSPHARCECGRLYRFVSQDRIERLSDRR